MHTEVVPLGERMPYVFAHWNPIGDAVEECNLDFDRAIFRSPLDCQDVPICAPFPTDDFLSNNGLVFEEDSVFGIADIIANELAHVLEFLRQNECRAAHVGHVVEGDLAEASGYRAVHLMFGVKHYRAVVAEWRRKLTAMHVARAN